MATSFLLAGPSRAQASTVLDFEAVATGNLNGIYGGVDFGTNKWVAGGYGFLPYPVPPGLGNQAVYFNPGQGSAMSFSFLTPEIFSGAWFSGPGTFHSPIYGQFLGTELVFNLYDSSNALVHTSGSVTTNSVGDPFTLAWINGSAQFLASGYSLPVSRVEVEIVNIAQISNNSSFIMDGVTFDTPTDTPVPEPATLALLGGGLATLLGKQARRRARDK